MDELNYPRITVVTPSYNQGKYLKQTILSVITQKYPNLEYIVLDGGSSDGSKEIIQQYSNHIRYWRSEPDNGQASAIADGFRIATGGILCWINSDDLFLPGALKKVGEFFASNPEAQWVSGGAAIIDENNKILYYRKPFPVTAKIMSCVVQGIVQQACFWQKELYNQVGGINPQRQFCMDLDLFLRFIHSAKLYRIPDMLAAFRQHNEAKTSKWGKIKRREDKLIRGQYNKNIPDFMKHAYWLYAVLWHKLNNISPKKTTYVHISQENIQ